MDRYLVVSSDGHIGLRAPDYRPYVEAKYRAAFDEVIVQLMKAIRCARGKAESLAWEVHTNGKALVYTGDLPRCIEVSGILEEIQLMMQIEV